MGDRKISGPRQSGPSLAALFNKSAHTSLTGVAGSRVWCCSPFLPSSARYAAHGVSCPNKLPADSAPATLHLARSIAVDHPIAGNRENNRLRVVADGNAPQRQRRATQVDVINGLPIFAECRPNRSQNQATLDPLGGPCARLTWNLSERRRMSPKIRRGDTNPSVLLFDNHTADLRGGGLAIPHLSSRTSSAATILNLENNIHRAKGPHLRKWH